MLVDSFNDFFDWEAEFYDPLPRKKLVCRHCNKSNGLFWRQISKQWIIHEKNGSVHSCDGYQIPIELLKEAVKVNTQIARKNAIRNLYDKARKRGGIKRVINLVSDEDLIALLTCFVKDSVNSFCYEIQIQALKEEIFRRMSKTKV